MSTASETKSAGVPAGATHVCTKCGQYFRFDEKEWSRRMLGAERDGGCVCDDLRPIAEAGPAPTTAAPAERPVGTCDASSLEHAKNPDCQNHRPAEQLSGKVVCDALPGKPHAEHCHPGWCINPRPAEQPGKAADPRPGEVLCDKPSYKHGGSHPQKATCVDPRPAQPQAPAEPTQEQIEKATAVVANLWGPKSLHVALVGKIAAALATVAAPLREERDRLTRALNEIVTHNDPDKMRALAYAALGAPEGQPPAPPQELLGKEGATADTVAEALDGYKHLIDSAEGLCGRPFVDHREYLDILRAASAPPRKAPQWRSPRCDYSLRTLLLVALDHVALESHLLRADMLEAIEVFAPAPSSPEEQLSEGATTKKGG